MSIIRRGACALSLILGFVSIATAQTTTAAAADAPAGGARGFIRDVVSDYKHMFSVENAEWLTPGAAASLAIHQADEWIREETQEESAALTTALKGGSGYGNLAAQFPLAIGWWAIGHGMGSQHAADAGRDLVRAQISALSWTYVLKFAVNRDRPNGDTRSFPSGHASATFATAMVLQEHYGWKVGVPMFGLATYTGMSRLTVNKHWASDVAFGAFLGMVCGRTVTLHVRNARFAFAPEVVPGGAEVALVALK
jgi:membrane-associated phospholipid phosphatase